MDHPPQTPDARWDLICDLVREAGRVAETERRAFLEERSSGDQSLVEEVLSLLRARTGGDGVLDRGAGAVAAAVFGQTGDRSLQVGSVVHGRYRIDSFLGSGGMGEVYAALDEELEEQVALKVLRPEYGADEKWLRRFRRETRLTRRIAHPNVCRVLDLASEAGGEGGATHYYVMELLRGETLAACIAREGAMGEPAALEIAGQIAEGLAAAHAAGVVHRDLKPSNIMLVEGELRRAVITDFGLAVAAEPEAASTNVTSGFAAGTPGYMAPEQLYGGPITPAADVYSFGLILHELITGVQRRAEVLPGIPSHWEKTIRACTCLDPSSRIASAPEVMAALLASSRVEGRLSRRKLVTGAIGLVAVTASSLIWRNSRQRIAFGNGSAVMLAEIHNQTGEPALGGVTELMRTQLQQTPKLTLLEAGQLGSALRQQGVDGAATESQLREAAWRLGAPLSVYGQVARVGGSYSLTIKLEQRGNEPQRPKAEAMAVFAARNRQEMFAAVRQAGEWILTQGAVSSGAEKERELEDVTTPSWEALSFYAQAERLARESKSAEAVLELESALDRDPAFTLASMRKADLLMSLNRRAEALRQWGEAMELLRKRPVTRREELRTRGMWAFDGGDLAEADRMFATWLLEFPHDWRAAFYRTVPLIRSDRTREAVENLRRVVKAQPGFGSAWGQLVNCHLILGEHGEAGEAIAKLRALGERERPRFKDGMAAFCRGEFGVALSEFRALGNSAGAEWRARAALYESTVLMEGGAHGRAVERLASASRAAMPDSEAAYLALAEAYGQWRLGRGAASREAARRALQRESGPLGMLHAGVCLARCGYVAEAEALRKSAEPLQGIRTYAVASARIAGEIALARRDQGKARLHFEAVSKLEPKVSCRSYRARVSETENEGHESVLKNVVLAWMDPMAEEPGVYGDALRKVAERGGEAGWVRRAEVLRKAVG